jgi:hypothetical protein
MSTIRSVAQQSMLPRLAPCVLSISEILTGMFQRRRLGFAASMRTIQFFLLVMGAMNCAPTFHLEGRRAGQFADLTFIPILRYAEIH